MSNTRIDNNNSELLSILDTVNALPEAGEGLDTSDATATASDILNGKTAYVDGEKITGNIAFQAAKTITPSTVNQIAISAGYYASGSVTVKGDSNLVAGNIKSVTSIFGIIGTYEGGGGSDDSEANDIIDGMITRTITEVSNNRVTSIGNNAFDRCSSLTSVNFPECTSIGKSAFYYCRALTNLTLGASSVATLNNVNAFVSTPISASTHTGVFGSIYVPASLVSAYKSATNWATYSSRITAIVK